MNKNETEEGTMTKSTCTRILRIIQAKEIIKDELGKAKNFRLFSIARPHMRAFHSSWFCFFVAFTSWFGVQPLIPTIAKELNLSKVEIANTGTASVAATIIVRVIIGPLCDRFGPRRVMSALLIGGAIPMALTGLVKNGIELLVVRLCIGILGGCFVPCQFWTSVMFNSKIVGTANAVVGGWGNLGGGFTFILMPGIFEGVKAAGADPFLAWKISVVIPAVVCIGIGILILFTADDSPQGSWSERLTTSSQSEITADENKKEKDGNVNLAFEKDESGNTNGSNKKLNHTLEPGFDQKPTTKVDVSVPEPEEESTCSCKRSFWLVVTVVILIIHYGMCFGIEISVNTVLNLYLLYKFKKPGCVEGGSNSLNSTIMSTTATLALNGTTLPPVTTTVDEYECSVLDQTTASLIASLFGLMNLFARALGGLFSDVLRSKFALPGRILGHMICMLGEGVMLIIFSQIETVPIAVLVIIFFSLFVQMSEGTTYAIVPYILPKYVGVIAGLVGAGGNAGSLLWNTLWSRMVEDNPSQWFWILGIVIICGSVFSWFLVVQGKRLINICSCEKGKQYNLSSS